MPIQHTRSSSVARFATIPKRIPSNESQDMWWRNSNSKQSLFKSLLASLSPLRKGLEVMSRSDKNWKNKVHQEIEEFHRFIDPVAHTIEDVRVGDTFFFRKSKVTVTEKTECEGNWRSHVHINKSNCFDIRTPIRMV